MKKFKKLLALLLAGTTLLSACGNDSEKKTAYLVEDGKLKVGLECAYAPFNWTQLTDENGAVPISGTKEYAGGYDVQIAKRVAEGMGLELEIIKTEWSGLPLSVQSGLIDVIIAGMSPTAERKEQIDFTDNYYTSDLVVVVKKDSKYASATSLADFAGAKIVAQQGTLHVKVVSQIPDVQEQTPMIDFSAMRIALDSGIIDGYVSERPEGLSASRAKDSFTFVSFEDGKGFDVSQDDIFISAGIKKGNTELAEKINAELAKITEEDRAKIMDDAIANQPQE